MAHTPDAYPEGVLAALGHITVLWSNVEASARAALLALSGATNKRAKQGVPIILAHMSMRDRLDALKTLCCLHMPVADYEAAEKWINHIANTLRNYRNRLAHDEWPALQKPHRSTPRVNLRAKVAREKSTANIRLTLESETYVMEDDLKSFAADLVDAITALEAITAYPANRPLKAALPPLALRQTTPKQTLSASLVHTKKKQKPKAPPRPSRA